jgi:geranylgeranyl pyrophosphate synthase
MGLIALAFDLAAANTTACGSPAAGSETAVHKLARAIGTAGLVRGQHVDLALTGRRATLELVETTYQQKAGALFLAAVQIPAGLAGMPAQDTARLEAYACGIGLAFQITDDLLDARAAAEDAGKSTFVSLLGVEGAQRRAQALVAEAVDALAPFGARAALLHTLANYVAIRAQ